MTIGGLRGAVAFYLALKVSSEYKHLIITTTISLILFTVIGMGSATPFVIKFLNKAFPQDEIIVKQNEEETPLNQEEKPDREPKRDNQKNGLPEPRHKGNENQMFEGIPWIEQFDKNYLQKFFRKDGWKFWIEGDEDKNTEPNKEAQKPNADLMRRMTKNYGDLSPHRLSNMINPDVQNKLAELNNARNKSDRSITPPTMKEIEKVTAQMKSNPPKALKTDCKSCYNLHLLI